MCWHPPQPPNDVKLYEIRPGLVFPAFQFNPEGKRFECWKTCYGPAVRRTSYDEVHYNLGTAGCSVDPPFWSWEVMGAVKTFNGQYIIINPGDWVIEMPIQNPYWIAVKHHLFEANLMAVPATELIYEDGFIIDPKDNSDNPSNLFPTL